MKYVLIFTAFIFSNITGGQVLLLDYNSKEIIPFANLMSDSTVVYSNENGIADITIFNEDDYIKVSAIGYKPQEMYRSSIVDSVFLQSIDNVLEEIVVLSDKIKIKKTKKLKDSKKLGNKVLPCHTNIITKVSSKQDLNNNKISSLIIPFIRHAGMSKEQKKKYYKSKLNLRVNIYEVDGNSLGALLYSSPTKNIITGQNDELSFTLREVDLKFTKEGFYIQLENLGAVDEGGGFIKCSGLFFARIDISDNESKEYNIESYRVAKNGSVDLEKQLNYTQFFGKNDLDKNFFLNYRFEYYE
nr:hypothetical protein [Nonlabens ulvanivorans]